MQSDAICFEVYPSGVRSSSLFENQLFFLTNCFVSFTIAGVFAWLGMWLIIPFAGLEMLALGVALYICQRGLLYREVIAIDEDEISISIGHKRIEKKCVLKRAWAKALLLPAGGMDNQSLWIRSHGKQVEIGACLNVADKRALANALNRTIQDGVLPRS